MNGELIPVATALVERMFSCIPIVMPKKAPCWAVLPKEWSEAEGKEKSVWKPFQSRYPTPEEISRFWANGAGIGIVCGAISGNLEYLDFDVPGKDQPGYVPVDEPPAYAPFVALVKEHGREDLLELLPMQRTPSGGRGMVYRCPGKPLGGNHKLASTAKNEPLIETRSEGGYFGAHPTPGYVMLRGNLIEAPVISEDDRAFLLTIASLLDERVLETHERQVRTERTVPKLGHGATPAEWYTANGPHLVDMLTGAGWKICGRSGKRTALTRPGKQSGLSGTVTEDGQCFWAFTTSTGFLPEYAYSKFSVYVMLAHNGNASEAAKTIRRDMMPKSSIQVQTDYERYTPQPAPGPTEPGWFDDAGDLVFRPLSEFQAKAPDFFWEGYLLNDNINLAEGKGSVGKSSFFLALAAGGSMGYLPFRDKAEPFTSVIFTKQDGPGAYRMKIAQLMGGETYDVDRICVFPATLTLDTTGLTKLAKFIERNDAKYIVFDPIKGMMPPYVKAEYDNPNIERFLNDLRSCCVSAGAAPQLVKHFARFTNGRELTDLGAGGEEWRNSARTQLVFLPHPDQESFPYTTGVFPARGFILGKPGRPFGYKVVSSGAIGWISPDDFDITPYAEAYPAVAQYYGIETESHTPKRGGGRKPTSSKPCLDFLIDFLQQNGPSFVARLRDECQSNGWDAKVMYRAKDMAAGRIQESAFSPKTWKLLEETK